MNVEDSDEEFHHDQEILGELLDEVRGFGDIPVRTSKYFDVLSGRSCAQDVHAPFPLCFLWRQL